MRAVPSAVYLAKTMVDQWADWLAAQTAGESGTMSADPSVALRAVWSAVRWESAMADWKAGASEKTMAGRSVVGMADLKAAAMVAAMAVHWADAWATQKAAKKDSWWAARWAGRWAWLSAHMSGST